MEKPLKKNMTDAERLELARKLDEDLENFINGLEKRQYTEGWPEDRWQEEMEKHPFFMKKPPEPGEQLSPLMEGLQQLKYDPNENTPDELATAYKDDGNFNFKHKNYRLAIIAYTEGIKVKCGNPEIEATLYNNRSAANYFLRNYRTALRDSEWALKIQPNYDKAVVRAFKCCYEMQQYDKAIEVCDRFLEHNPENQDLVELRQKCVKQLKVKQRDLRKKQLEVAKRDKVEEELLNHIRRCGINIEGGKDGLKLEYLEPHVPELADHRVFLNESGTLVWPVIFTYPEHRVMDFVQQFAEDDLLKDHIEEMFGEHPEWDIDRKYSPSDINVYFEDHNGSRLYPVNANRTLSEIIRDKRFVVRGGTPAFLLFVKDSPAEAHFLKQYGLKS